MKYAKICLIILRYAIAHLNHIIIIDIIISILLKSTYIHIRNCQYAVVCVCLCFLYVYV